MTRKNVRLVVIVLSLAGCSIDEGSEQIDHSAGQASPITESDDGRTWASPETDADPVAHAANLQQRVDDVLASIPGGHQVSATKIDYDGLIVTFDPNYSAEKAAFAPTSVICSGGWFCIVVRGTTFSFFKCQMWDLQNWVGDAPYNNNQTDHAVARAYNKDFTQEFFTNTATSAGTVNVTPWFHFQPCLGPDKPGP